jgi:hypothetical protein
LKKLIEGQLKENFRTLNARKGAEDVLFDQLLSRAGSLPQWVEDSQIL